jgi:hypothetical protein
MTWRRRGIPITVIVLSCATLQGCGPAQVGVAGISVAADGSPLGVIQVCRNKINAADLYDSRLSRPGIGHWIHDGPVTGFSTWPLNLGGNGWTVQKSLPTLDGHVNYNFYAGSLHGSGSTVNVDFTLEDLAIMKPGQVRYFAHEGEPESRAYAAVSIDDFRANACK